MTELTKSNDPKIKEEWAKRLLESLKEFDFKIENQDTSEAMVEMMIKCVESMDASENQSSDEETFIESMSGPGLIKKWDFDQNQKLYVEFIVQALPILEGQAYEQFKIALTEYSKKED